MLGHKSTVSGRQLLSVAWYLFAFVLWVFFSGGVERSMAMRVAYQPHYEYTQQHNQRKSNMVLRQYRSGSYHCLQLITHMMQSRASQSLSLRAYYSFLKLIYEADSFNADKDAAISLENVDPFLEGGIRTEEWQQLWYGCTVPPSGDTVLQRVYRLGLEQTAQKLRSLGMYHVSQYLYPRDPTGENLMHLAVRSGNPNMVRVLGELLHEHVIYLLEGPMATNLEGNNPRDLAFSLRLYGVGSAVTRLYNTYKDMPKPSLVPPPDPIEMPNIQLLEPVGPPPHEDRHGKWNEEEQGGDSVVAESNYVVERGLLEEAANAAYLLPSTLKPPFLLILVFILL